MQPVALTRRIDPNAIPPAQFEEWRKVGVSFAVPLVKNAKPDGRTGDAVDPRRTDVNAFLEQVLELYRLADLPSPFHIENAKRTIHEYLFVGRDCFSPNGDQYLNIIHWEGTPDEKMNGTSTMSIVPREEFSKGSLPTCLLSPEFI